MPAVDFAMNHTDRALGVGILGKGQQSESCDGASLLPDLPVLTVSTSACVGRDAAMPWNGVLLPGARSVLRFMDHFKPAFASV